MYTSASCEKSQLSMTVCSDLPLKGFTIDKFIVQELVVVGGSILGNPFNRRSIFSLNLQNCRRDLQPTTPGGMYKQIVVSVFLQPIL